MFAFYKIQMYGGIVDFYWSWDIDLLSKEKYHSKNVNMLKDTLKDALYVFCLNQTK